MKDLYIHKDNNPDDIKIISRCRKATSINTSDQSKYKDLFNIIGYNSPKTYCEFSYPNLKAGLQGLKTLANVDETILGLTDTVCDYIDAETINTNKVALSVISKAMSTGKG